MDIKLETDTQCTEAKCLGCQKMFPTQAMLLLDRIIIPSLCPDCADRRDSRIVEWMAICPYEFRTQPEGGATRFHLMDAASPKWREILTWQFGHRGLLIRGETGKCKTRAMWRLLRRLFDEQKRIVCFTAAGFDRQCRDAGGNFTLSAWFDRLAAVDVLFLDDIGKAAWTQGTEAQVFDLVDKRTREGRPILATTNETGETLAARLSEDKGGPLVRRIRDYCETKVF